MARRVRGENREVKTNGRGVRAAKTGGTLGSRHGDQRESSADGRSGAQAESQDHLHQLIAERAFFLYERSGFQDGKDLEHWLEAEQQVTGVRGQAA